MFTKKCTQNLFGNLHVESPCAAIAASNQAMYVKHSPRGEAWRHQTSVTAGSCCFPAPFDHLEQKLFAAGKPRLPDWEHEHSRFKSRTLTFLEAGTADCVEKNFTFFFREKTIYIHPCRLANIPPLFPPSLKANLQPVVTEIRRRRGGGGDGLPATQTDTQLPALEKNQPIDVPDPSHHVS